MSPNRSRRAIVVASVLLSLSVTACSSSGSDDGAGGTTDPAVVERAQELVAAGIEGMIGFSGAEKDIDIDALSEYTEWNGPTVSPKPKPGAKIEVIACAFGTACEESGKSVVAAAEELGWTATLRDGQGTPENFQKVMSTVAAQKPDAVITVSIPENQVADGIAELEDQGIPTVGISAIDEGGSVGYSAYVSSRETLLASLEALYVIADSEGTGKAVYLWVDGYPHIEEALVAAQRVFSSCAGCEELEVRRRTLQQSTDPVEMANITNSLVQQHGEDLEYIILPFGLGGDYVLEALREAGRDDVKVVTKNAEPERLGAVAAGKQEADFGAIRGWNAYAAVDQVNRILNGEDPLPDSEQGIPAHIFVKENAPADGKVDWPSFVDYPTYYREMWGLE